MSKKLSGFLIFGLSSILIMCLVPPWEHRRGPIGYFPLWAPPEIPSCSIDSERLFFQVIVLVLASAIALLISNQFKFSGWKDSIALRTEKLNHALERKKRLFTTLLIVLTCLALAIIPLNWYMKLEKEKKARRLAEEQSLLDKKLNDEREKELRIAALIARDEAAKQLRFEQALAKPKRWLINLRERQIKGVATTRWLKGLMKIELELTATPELIELADARQESMHISFFSKVGNFIVNVPVPPGSLIVQKDKRGAWSRLVMIPSEVPIGSKEYSTLAGIRVIYDAYGF